MSRTDFVKYILYEKWFDIEKIFTFLWIEHREYHFKLDKAILFWEMEWQIFMIFSGSDDSYFLTTLGHFDIWTNFSKKEMKNYE